MLSMTKRILRRAGILFLTWIAVRACTVEGFAFAIIQFSPQGILKDVRQVTAQFSEPIVPLGDPRGGGEPFDLSCPEAGSAHWVDSTH